jgi:hypothetical protein
VVEELWAVTEGDEDGAGGGEKRGVTCGRNEVSEGMGEGCRRECWGQYGCGERES